MNTRDLAYFSALVELKNYTAVAARFSVSQPTITVAVKRLETEFNATLVQRDRAHNTLTITRPGLMLYQRAQMVLKDLDLAHSEVQRADQSTIRFGMPPIIGTLWFPLVAGELFSRGLLKYVETLEMGSGYLLQELLAGKIDVALLGSVRPLNERGLDATLLGAHEFRAIVSPEHRLAPRKRIAFAELANENFISLTGKFVHPQALRDYSQFAGFDPRIVYNTPNISLIKALVASGFGVSLIVGDTIHASDKVVALRLSDPVADRFNMSLVVRKNFLPNEIQREFISVLFGLRHHHEA
ncbi:LysR family transcriptional regulator [Levilactobacillus zymae]|uniref:Malolactic regulator n=1 Tax=Levilactobacillus zymae TaxID=267363 RepID=A0A1Y6K265_9LACO|nr:LysR family transcriptional regulator [Levilactobacillus zymae]SMS15462.1 Malolactic regulator [Levilactobacillus zymae]